MRYEKTKIKWRFTEIWEDMVEQDWELVYFSEQYLLSFWKRKIKTPVYKWKRIEYKVWDTITIYENLNEASKALWIYNSTIYRNMKWKHKGKKVKWEFRYI